MKVKPSVTLPIPIEKLRTRTENMAKRTEQSELETLKEMLALANLKIAGLETMIDIAEDQLGLDIRKKSGTKQFR